MSDMIEILATKCDVNLTPAMKDLIAKSGALEYLTKRIDIERHISNLTFEILESKGDALLISHKEILVELRNKQEGM